MSLSAVGTILVISEIVLSSLIEFYMPFTDPECNHDNS